MGEVLSVKVPAQRGKPYSFGGKFFIRERASSQQMSRDEIREFFFAEGAIRFDESPCRRFSLDSDLDEEAWAVFRRRAKIPGSTRSRTGTTVPRPTSRSACFMIGSRWLAQVDFRRG